MKKHIFSKVLSVALVLTALVFYSVNQSEVSANQNKKKTVALQQPLKVASFRMVYTAKSDRPFVGWNIYKFVKPTGSSTNGDGC